jgi:protein-tyrosine-phosphatase
MKTVKCKFTIATQYVKSEYSEEQEVQVESDATQDEIDDAVNEAYSEWLNNHNYGGVQILEVVDEPDEDEED